MSRWLRQTLVGALLLGTAGCARCGGDFGLPPYVAPPRAPRVVIPVDAPVVSRPDGSADRPVPDLVLVVPLTGPLFLDGEALEEKKAYEEVKRRAAANPDLRVVLSIDGRVPYSRVMRVIDRVKAAGVQHFALNVQVESGNADTSGSTSRDGG